MRYKAPLELVDERARLLRVLVNRGCAVRCLGFGHGACGWLFSLQRLALAGGFALRRRFTQQVGRYLRVDAGVAVGVNAVLKVTRHVHAAGTGQLGEEGVGAVGVGSCVDPQVTAYLLGDVPAQRETVCPGKPLEGEGEATAQKAQPADGTPPTYTDPEKARALIDEFKRSLVPSSLRP